MGDPQFPAGGSQFELPAKTTKAIQKTSDDADAVKFRLTSDMKVCVAFDYMRVKVGEIGEMQHYTPALLKLFVEEEKEVTKVVGGKEVKEKKKWKREV